MANGAVIVRKCWHRVFAMTANASAFFKLWKRDLYLRRIEEDDYESNYQRGNDSTKRKKGRILLNQFLKQGLGKL